MHPGHTYTLVVDAAARPTYYDATAYPRRPTQADQQFQNAGPHRWALGITMTRSLRSHPLWNIGVKINGVLHVLRVRIA